MTYSRAPRRSFALALEPLEGRSLLSMLSPHMVPAPTVHVETLHQSQSPGPIARQWAWLANTYWYVPKANLPAMVYSPTSGTLIPVLDQTVYHITAYSNGYFWGDTVTQIGSGKPSSSALIGSVTPEGKVLLDFVSGSGVTQGYGTMVQKNGQWTMENQMFTGSSSGTQIGHWAYMVQTRQGMTSWKSLPLVNVSVPKFLSNYSAPSPTPAF